MHYIKYSFLFTLLSFLNCVHAQISGIINAYTKVTAIATLPPTLTVTSTNGFAIGDKVLIIQMKGATINTANNATFGDITAYNNAGNYEFTEIQDIQGLNIALKYNLLRTYTPADLVQLVTIPQYTDVTVTGTLTAQAWDGNVGGVLVFEALGTVTLNADIDVSGLGFRGGKTNINDLTTTPSCVNSIYLPSTNTSGAGKGESISEYILNFENGCGKQANGGGGGLRNNSGGGGGANFGTGGKGGNANACSIFPNAPGVGANSLVYNNSNNKIFLGGGGGAGHQNNLHNGGHSTPGGNGGGIVVLKACNIVGNNFTIKSNGIVSAGPSPAVGDAAGGGGGGGGVVIECPTYNTLNIEVTGGNGDNVTDGTGRDFGPGGGGGGGFIWVSTITLSGNISANLNGGIAGISSFSNTNRGALAGSSGGTLTGLVIPRSNAPTACTTPLDLLEFKITNTSNRAKLEWTITQNTDFKYFVVERSLNGYTFETIGTISASAKNNFASYSFTDPNILEQGTYYYKLSQVDNKGNKKSLGIRFINNSAENWLSITPNPFSDYFKIQSKKKILSIEILNTNGQIIYEFYNLTEDTPLQINSSLWQKGIYIIKISNNEELEYYKILK